MEILGFPLLSLFYVYTCILRDSPVLLLEDGWEAYPELVDEAVCAPSLKESHMFTFVTIASSNKGLNLRII